MIDNIFSLKNKTIVITGGAGHLGKAMSEALAAFGANLFIVGYDEDKNKKYAMNLKDKYKLDVCIGGNIDLKDEDSIKIQLANIIDKTGKIDILINNAAFSCAGKVENMTNDDWCKGIDGTINGVFRVTKYTLQQMIKQQYGNIINIASMYGMVAPDSRIYGNSGFNNPANYGAGKAAIIQFTKYLATTYGNKNIRANSISPGPFPSCEVQKNKEFIKNLSSKNPLGRIGRPEDLQGIIVLLASDASSYLTGQNIAVDGGWTAW
ncbi:SDR family oxidoreductase [Anaerosinus gibii]|uniref:SDR family oxidoreductase n=1 Tax=Selenobaculum gibii TaxID=3054208 RepID=A0A9Y2AIT1_9FIRM|nr:SDR family oxidoreductase [Selenobaculum gbiensis]WIW71082.1 SDR family oxidoreductase [Selenobaculum gbiensis]